MRRSFLKNGVKEYVYELIMNRNILYAYGKAIRSSDVPFDESILGNSAELHSLFRKHKIEHKLQMNTLDW